MIIYRTVYHEHEGYQPIERVELTNRYDAVSELNFASEMDNGQDFSSFHVRYFMTKGGAVKYIKTVNKELAEEVRKQHELDAEDNDGLGRDLRGILPLTAVIVALNEHKDLAPFKVGDIVVRRYPPEPAYSSGRKRYKKIPDSLRMQGEVMRVKLHPDLHRDSANSRFAVTVKWPDSTRLMSGGQLQIALNI